MEVLNALISAAERYNLLKPIDPKVQCRAFLYADDVIVLLPHGNKTLC